MANKDSVIEDCETLAAMLEDTTALDRKITAAQAEVDSVLERNKALIREHAVTGIAQEEFDRKAATFEEQYRKADTTLERLNAEKQDRQMRARVIRKYVEDLRAQAGPIGVWDEQAWRLLVSKVTVNADGSAEFLFRGGNRITIKSQEKSMK